MNVNALRDDWSDHQTLRNDSLWGRPGRKSSWKVREISAQVGEQQIDARL